MKKMWVWLGSVLLVLAAGCGQGGGRLDMRPIERSFAHAEPPIKAVADRAMAAAQKADYHTVVGELSRLADHDKLTPEQRQALQKVLPKARKLAAATQPKSIEQRPLALPR